MTRRRAALLFAASVIVGALAGAAVRGSTLDRAQADHADGHRR